MPEKNDKYMRSDFEGFVKAVLNGDTLNTALDFAAFLRANDMTAGGEHGEISYMGKCLCYMHLDGIEQAPGPWTIWTEGDYSKEHEDVPMDERMKGIAWAHVNHCASCGGSCSPGMHKVIFGKVFENVCSADMAFHTPDTEAMECIKKLLEKRKIVLSNS